jgi:hypothetical protein
MHAKLDALLLGGMKKPAVPPPVFTARRRPDEDRATPLPLEKVRRAAAPLSGPPKR